MHVIQYATSNTDTVSNSKWYKKRHAQYELCKFATYKTWHLNAVLYDDCEHEI